MDRKRRFLLCTIVHHLSEVDMLLIAALDLASLLFLVPTYLEGDDLLYLSSSLESLAESVDLAYMDWAATPLEEVGEWKLSALRLLPPAPRD